ncbi:DUF6457 domain-containing protein [Aeromicrobium duanguangcaii]|uniref:DUF6457 domain-containing protein n=1 Tax=Aeromicrobium duanguangcaii TaxID=2968086 RepID=A0ABY5KFR3_9ACTN|nr:DUF6457 domain-containing protein [Aeromicrobium duanguangcaii]MCD9153615.1 DUF6457 domain-containing protein [Aeromicrobium duanguangcaii]UUI69302.1 DUF6457 domain-containing protein [Aeromicrobium duanguangcaii]
MSNDDEILQRWWRDLCTALGVEPDADPEVLLDLAGTAAHAVVRPAAPLTTFLVGYAAGLADADAAGMDSLVERAERAAEDFG